MPDRSSTEQTVPPRVIVPFAGAAIVGLLVVLLPGPETDWVLFGTAAALTVAIAVVGLVAARLRRARVLIVALPLAYFFVVAMLRHSGTTGASGFVPLVMLPIVWLALFGQPPRPADRARRDGGHAARAVPRVRRAALSGPRPGAAASCG